MTTNDDRPQTVGSNEAFSSFKAEVVTKDDGRYLIYYSWPDASDDDPEPDAERKPHPQPQPWVPETGPSDV